MNSLNVLIAALDADLSVALEQMKGTQEAIAAVLELIDDAERDDRLPRALCEIRESLRPHDLSWKSRAAAILSYYETTGQHAHAVEVRAALTVIPPPTTRWSGMKL